MNWLALAGINGAVAVALGAFGAHGLKTRLTAEALAWWQTGVQYHLVHAVVLLVLALALPQRPALGGAAWLMLVGTVLFSGSLYAMALGAPRWLGAVVPLGGASWIAAWLWIAWAARS